MRLLALAIAALLFLPFSATASHESDCAQVTSGGRDGDADRDGMPDTWEEEHFDDLCQEADGDYDHDGLSNLEEFKRHTDPADARSPGKDSNSGNGSNSSGSGNGSASGSNSGPGSANSGSNSLAEKCRDSEERKQCVRDYCEDRPEDRQCKAVVKEACERRDCAALSASCSDAASERKAKACAALTGIDKARSGAKHIDFSLDREGRELVNYTVGGTLVFSSIAYGDAGEEFKFRQDGARIRFDSDDARLEIHDSATGQFWFRSDDGSLTLVMPEGVGVTPTSNGHLLDYSGRTARIAGDYTLEGMTIVAYDEFRFFSPVKNGAATRAVDDAKAAGKLGAEAKISSLGSEVTAYDDMDVNITTPASINASTPLRVVVSAELQEGRTIIIDVDPALLTGPDLELRYFDVLDDGNETEVVFRMASSLADVLDPSDDGGQPEYWIVEDEDGLHVMASIPHWSTHAIELASVGEFLVQPSVLIGVAAGVVGVAVASMAMFWPRRQDSF